MVSKKFNLLTGEISDIKDEDYQEDHKGYLKSPFFYYAKGAYYPLIDDDGEYMGFVDGSHGHVHAKDCEKYVKEFQWIPETE